MKNSSDWERRGFDPRHSQEIYFCVKNIPPIRANIFNEEKSVLPDCYLQPQNVWVTVDDGQFQVCNKNINKINLNKVECSSNLLVDTKYDGCWESGQVVFTPEGKERFTFKFHFQFKTLCFNQMNAIIEQTTNYLFLRQTNCDIHFHFFRSSSIERIGAHRDILSARSSVFAAMFNHDMQESKSGEINIQDFEKDIFYELLHFIYSGRTSVPLTEIMARLLLAAADKYDVQELKDECANFLLPHVIESTAQKMFEMADAFNVDNLKDECERILLLDIQMINVLHLIIWADLNSARKVKKESLNFARDNRKTLFQSDDYEKMMREYPDICLEATRHMTR